MDFIVNSLAFNFGLILIGVVLLYFGGDLLISNASKLAVTLGISPLVIGLTVVAFGTSLPELAASITAVLRNAPGLSLGNVIGSNIANLGLVLSISALIFPLTSSRLFTRREIPFMLFVSFLLIPLMENDVVGRVEATILVIMLVAYTTFLLRSGELEDELDLEEMTNVKEPMLGLLLWTAGGIVLLVLGAQVLVQGATFVAQSLGVPDRIIGLTLVAVGTSLPELASCVVAAMKKQGDILIGNLVGSNIFNILSIIGITALIRPLLVPLEASLVDIFMMMLISAVTWFFLAFGLRIGRVKGGVLLFIYLAYIGYLGMTLFNA